MRSHVRVVTVGLGLIALSGCSATIGTTAEQAAQQIDTLIPELIMLKYQALHNLKVGMEQIDSTPGMVTMVQPPPVVTPTAPVVMPAPSPPMPVSSPTPTPPISGVPSTFPSSPTVTPTPARRVSYDLTSDETPRHSHPMKCKPSGMPDIDVCGPCETGEIIVYDKNTGQPMCSMPPIAHRAPYHHHRYFDWSGTTFRFVNGPFGLTTSAVPSVPRLAISGDGYDSAHMDVAVR